MRDFTKYPRLPSHPPVAPVSTRPRFPPSRHSPSRILPLSLGSQQRSIPPSPHSPSRILCLSLSLGSLGNAATCPLLPLPLACFVSLSLARLAAMQQPADLATLFLSGRRRPTELDRRDQSSHDVKEPPSLTGEIGPTSVADEQILSLSLCQRATDLDRRDRSSQRRPADEQILSLSRRRQATHLDWRDRASQRRTAPLPLSLPDTDMLSLPASLCEES